MTHVDAQLTSSVVFGVGFFSDCRKLTGHVSRPSTASNMDYDPKEFPRMYPLELRDDHVIWLWSADGALRWKIAEFVNHPEGPVLQFVGMRPFNARVNWTNLREIILQGYSMLAARERADKLFLKMEQYGS